MAYADERRYEKILARHGFTVFEDTDILEAIKAALEFQHKRYPAYQRVPGTTSDEDRTIAITRTNTILRLWEHQGTVTLSEEFSDLTLPSAAAPHH